MSDAEFTGAEIAIIGMACRFPGANDPRRFWQNLCAGVESVTTLTDEELLASGVAPSEFNHPDYVKAAPILDDVESFDAAFFGFSPLEAEIMDPQQRIFLECAWEALEQAGYNPETYEGAIGVYTGARTNTYVFNIVSNPELFKSLGIYQISLGNDLASLATSVSFKLNLKGPSYAVHTACSTSLVAVHLARQSLLLDECQMALAGGVAVNVPHKVGYLYQEGSLLSPDGHCRAFDAQAQGTIFGSGAGVVVLKRLEDALADGDYIYAIVRGSATNNDGSTKATFTAPSVDGQAKVIVDALIDAEIRPETIRYIEAHATGTALGDPIEFRALTKAFRMLMGPDARDKGFCALGSVKTNVGHLDAAAGMPALIKTTLALQHGQIPPSLHFQTPNPRIDLENSPFYVNATLSDLKSDGTPRRAGVSSFGFGGTNAHVILEQAPLREPSGASRPWQLLVLSARTDTALETATTQLVDHLTQQAELDLADVAYTLQVGRKGFDHRRMVVCQNLDEVITALEERDPERVLTETPKLSDRPVVFMFSGQGAQYVGMGRGLYEDEPLFREHVDRCCELLQPHLGLDLRTLLYPDEDRADAAAQRLNQTALTQPALFTIEYALAQLWMAWGVQPQAMIGHSIGEYVAACLVGVFSLQDALALVAARGRLMQELPRGAMLAIPMPEDEVYPLLDQGLSLAAVNAPGSCVVSGPTEAVEALERRLAERELNYRRLHTSHAFHSAMMDPILEPFTARVQAVELQSPQIPFISNVTGTWMTAEDATDPDYWARHLRQAVRFADGIAELINEPARVLLEVGPGTTLSTLARRHPSQPTALASLRHPKDQRVDGAFTLTTLGRLWLSGVQVDWSAFWAGERRQRLPLPAYPFEHQRYWIDPAGAATLASYGPPAKKSEVADWFYRPVWKRTEGPAADAVEAPAEDAASWLIFQDECGLGPHLVQRLEEMGQEAIVIQAGARFERVAERTFVLDPHQRDDYETLLKALDELDKRPTRLLHLWSVTPDDDAPSDPAAFARFQDRGFYSLMFLAQAWGNAPLQMTVVSNHVQAVEGDERLCPAKATLLGPCLVIPQEHFSITCRSVDIVLPPIGTFEETDLIDKLLSELMVSASDSLIAYRGADRWVQSYEPISLDPSLADRPVLREKGAYLITGGLGGIGLTLSEHLARAVQARLVLTGRTTLPPREEWDEWLSNHDEGDFASARIRHVRALEALGAEVLILGADVADLDQMRAVLAQAEARFGAIHGVVHCAGLTSDEWFHAIQETERAEVESHFRAKAYGLYVLEQALQGRTLDFCLLQSSLASILGGFSYVAYAAANLFMDAFAHQQRQDAGRPWISVNWDSWHAAQDGMEGAVGVTLTEQAITPPEGVQAFQRALALNIPQAIVSTSDLQARIDQWVRLKDLRGAEAQQAAGQPLAGSLPARAELERRITVLWEKVLGVPQVGLQDNFFDLGGNSLSGMQLISELKRELGVQVSPVTLFEAPTVGALVHYLSPEEAASASAGLAQGRPRPVAEQQEIAIVGMVGRFPGAEDLEAFWQNLRDGVESITFFSDQELRAAGVDAALLEDPSYVKARPILNDVASFDAAFFGYSPREAELMDPQHRVFLECAWQALEHAGYDSERYPGAVGVYAGASISTYLLNLYSNAGLIETIDPLQTVIGNDKDSLTTSVSYKLNLKGPSIAVQTFCSTSLVAVHLACQSLQWGECDMALAGGVTILLPQTSGYTYQEGNILSPDGHVRTFDAGAQGTLFGNGVGVVVLKRLDEALADGDRVYAVLKGSAINNDGSLKVGYTAPSVEGQAQVIAAAQAAAGVAPESISYVEAHGTGTALGDPVEIAALTKAFRVGTEAQGFCAIGSLKSNVGHLDRAAGVAALIKTVLALGQGQIPPSLHYERPNPRIDFENSPFYVNTELAEWRTNGGPRRAGVSALGFGGTNAHVIVEEAPPLEPSEAGRPWQLLLLSARTATALEAATANLAAHLQAHPELNPSAGSGQSLADVAYTLQVGRRGFRQRRMVVCRDQADAVAALEGLAAPRVLTEEREPRARPVAFLFSGQGAQYVGMGRELYERERLFREQVDRCCELLEPHLGLGPEPVEGLDLRTVLYPPEGEEEKAGEKLRQTALTQPALFVIEYALAQLWMGWGVQPQAMLGHSIGEYVAACLAGVFSLEDALALVAARGRLMGELPAGAMLAVPLAEEEVQALLGPELSLAVINGPERCVVSGPAAAVEGLEKRLKAQEVPCRRLHTSHAFHSAMMEPMLEAFRARVEAVTLHPPQRPYLSNVTGTWIEAQEATDPDYWVRHVRQTVRFAEGLGELLQEPERVLLEVGPGQTLSALARQHDRWTPEQTVVTSLRHPQDEGSDLAFLLTALGRLWLAGLDVDWEAFYSDERRQRVPLPTYPFERQRYWIKADAEVVGAGRRPPRRSTKTDPADWLYVPSWKRSMLPESKPPRESAAESSRIWLVFADALDVGLAVVQQLRQAGEEVTLVSIGERFGQIDEGTFTLDPRRQEDYGVLLARLRSTNRLPNAILHLWGVTKYWPTELDVASFDVAQELGFYSLVFLAQALDQHGLTDPLELWVVTNDLHEVNGEEALRPEKATVLGALRAIPQEYPYVTCRNIDLVVPATGVARPVRQIMAEIIAQRTDLVVAYRGYHRWLPTFETVSYAGAAEHKVSLEAGGVYLVTGGLGDAGFKFTENLARLAPAKLFLVEPTSLPERTEWEQWLSVQDVAALELSNENSPIFPFSVELAREQGVLIRLADQVERNLQIEKLPEELESASDQLCTSYLCDYLQSSGIEIIKGETYSTLALRRRLRMLTKFAKLFEFMLSVLEADGIVALTEGEITFVKDVQDVASSADLRGELRRRYPESEEGFQALEHCVRHYGQVLTGEMDAISVLYPGGNSDMMRAIEENQLEFSNLRVCRALAAETLAHIAGKASGQPLRILEVGAGDGQLTWEVLPALKNHNVEYYFTDIGRSFVLNAEERAAGAGLDFVKFGVLDISRDPAEQGFEKYSFDIILASEVVHATTSVKATLENLKKLLRPNGLLFILEATRAQRWATLVWGLLDGWWHFDDEDVRRFSPLLSPEKWAALLAEQAFENVQVYPHSEDTRSGADYALLIAQQPVEIRTPDYVSWVEEIVQKEKQHIRTRLERVQALEALGAETLVVSADVADRDQIRAVLDRAREHWGEIQGVVHAVDFVSPEGEIAIRAIDRAGDGRRLEAQALKLSVLDKVLQNHALDFALVLFPWSVAVQRGTATDSAAKCFIDAFASQSWQRGAIHWTSVSWDLRGEAEEMPVESHKALQRVLVLGSVPQVLVSPHDLEVEAAQWNQARQEVEIAPAGAEPGLHPRPSLSNAYAAPRDEREETIVRIWQEILGIAQVGIHDNFLDLGGDSLMATQLVSRLRAAFQLDLPIRAFFEAPTVAGLAGAIAATQTDQEEQMALEILAQLEQFSEEQVIVELQKRKTMLDN